MSEIQKILLSRELPDLLHFADGSPVTAENFEERRKEILSILSNEIYGTAPEYNGSVRASVIKRKEKQYAGKGTQTSLLLTVDTDKGEFSFPIVEVVPSGEGKYPTFVMLNFRPDVPDKYLPVEELLDAGCAVVRIHFNDVSADKNDDFSSGLAAMYDRKKYTWGKIRMWAWAASRVMDYLETQDYVDMTRVGVVGHSRLGKTALVAAAYDTRFTLSCSNDSGCAGSAITRNKLGETVKNICERFPYWFCEKYHGYSDRESELSFDQHFLIGAIAPRRVSIGSAIEDTWADPDSEYLSACAASPAWEIFGKEGLVHPDRLPRVDDDFFEGEVTYHLRAGTHFFSHTDWKYYIRDIKR